MRSSEQGGGIRHLLARSSSSITREAFFRSHVDKLQQTALSAMISLQKKHKYPDEFISKSLARSLVVLTAERDSLLKDDNIESFKRGK